MDASWGQYVEGGKDKTKTIFQGLNSCSGFQKAPKNDDKMIAIIHHANHWSFTVKDTRKRTLQMYDPKSNIIHKRGKYKIAKRCGRNT